MVAILMMPAKLAILDLKINVFCNKGDDIIISVHDNSRGVLLVDAQ